MKTKTSELSGAGLDWAVAAALRGEYKEHRFGENDDAPVFKAWVFPNGFAATNWGPSTDWGQGGPLIHSNAIEISPGDAWQKDGGGCWGAMIITDRADADCSFVTADADTPLIAACRAIVAANLGDEVELPESLR